MLINYDPDETPDITPEFIDECKRQNLHVVSIICDEPGARVGDAEGVSFVAKAAFIPRPGDRIQLQDGRLCDVKSVAFKVVTEHNTSGKAKSILLVPNVIAQLTKKTTT